ncbi:MAG TPA: hypothetical protein VMG10_19015 [Gemmataceae bacterium]|nr:hypothetical protein [Gemmataceae bacterium]
MNPQRFQPSFRVLSLGVALILPATAQAQSELNKPYNLHIVVYVAENRLLTDVFRDRIERELHDGFQAGLGDMGRVTVSHEHPRLDDVVARGLKLSLDGWRDRRDVKTHFVLIDYSGVHYEIQTRQYDGSVGRASPVVRRDRTRDRDFVAKAAALLIKQDFGLLGTVRTAPARPKEQVKVELRGGGLGDLTRWVKKDDVFALAPPGGGSPRALEWSFLQVEKEPDKNARDGLCVCRFFHRYRVPSIAGYRCIKLGTVQTPLRLHWYQKVPGSDKKARPLDVQLMVEVRRYGFDGEDATRLQESTERNGGILETVHEGKDGVFTNVAFVRVISGMPDPKPQVPIALVDDQPIAIEVNVANDVDTLFNVSLARWKNNVRDSLNMQDNLFERLKTLGPKAENRNEIIQEAESGLKRSQKDLADLLTEKNKILEAARDKKILFQTPREDALLRGLKEREQTLAQFIEEQKKIEKSENDPQRKKWLSDIESARLLEKELEIDKAIAIYERIQKEGYKDAGLDAYVKKLHTLWDTKDAELKEARGFIYRVWPTLDTSRLEDNILKAQKAFEKCKKAGDRISIRKMLKGTEGHADRLAKELKELKPELIIDDVEPARKLQMVSAEVIKLGADIQGYLTAHADDK